MKVDLGQCAVCGAKNSKYVEKCYKCGAALPWAPDYVAPQDAPPTAAMSAGTDGKTVAAAPADDAPSETSDFLRRLFGVSRRVTAEASSETFGHAPGKMGMRSKSTVLVGVALMALGLGMWVFLRTLRDETPLVAATPVATAVALAPIVPTETAQTIPAPSGAPEIGPTFDELYANTTQGTPRQQQLYWESVKGQTINWRGEFVSLGNAAAGPLVVNCKAAQGALKVTVNLDEATPQRLPQYKIGDSVPFAGVLQSRDAEGVMVSGGRAG